LDQYSGTEIGRRGKEAVAASVDHASSEVVKKNFLRNEDEDLSYLKNNVLQKIPSSPKFVMKKKALRDPHNIFRLC
jgi:hypothetical protein